MVRVLWDPLCYVISFHIYSVLYLHIKMEVALYTTGRAHNFYSATCMYMTEMKVGLHDINTLFGKLFILTCEFFLLIIRVSLSFSLLQVSFPQGDGEGRELHL